MVDHVSPEVRSRIMASVRSKGTKPEMTVRRALHRLGYRYRLHRKGLPGRPDLTFVSRKKVLFINGCFWHLHPGCSRAKIPRTNQVFWVRKLTRNRSRDADNIESLRKLGWDTMTVWQCELRDLDSALNRIVIFLGPRTASAHTHWAFPATKAPPAQSSPVDSTAPQWDPVSP